MNISKAWRSQVSRVMGRLLAQKEVVSVETNGRICWEIAWYIQTGLLHKAGFLCRLSMRTYTIQPDVVLAATELYKTKDDRCFLSGT